MSFDQLSSMESQPTTTRRSQDPEFQDDPEFDRFTEELSTNLFTLTSNISRLSQQINLLGTKRDTPRARERVHDLLEEAREGFREAGDGIKRLTAWEDLNVRRLPSVCQVSMLTLSTAVTKIHAAKAVPGIPGLWNRVPGHTAPCARETEGVGVWRTSGHRVGRHFCASQVFGRTGIPAAAARAAAFGPARRG